MSFTIRNQTAGVINNVDGNQHNAGSQVGVLVTDRQAVEAATALLGAVQRAAWPALVRDQVAAEAARLVEDTKRSDKPAAASRLQRIVSLVTSVASLATGGSAVVTAVRALAGWLGRIGAPILQRLG